MAAKISKTSQTLAITRTAGSGRMARPYRGFQATKTLGTDFFTYFAHVRS
jgi:hypothetical protein